MVAYSFNGRFAGAILSGRKSQTIRGDEHFDRERDGKPGHVVPGQAMELFAAADGKGLGRRLIGRAPCVKVHPVTLYLSGIQEGYSCGLSDSNPDPRFAAADVHRAECNRFAERDGFDSWTDLVSFWAKMYPGLERFDGLLIAWKPLDGWTP